MRRALLTALIFGPLSLSAREDSPWGDWIEPGSPFVSSVIDCREQGGEHNLTPRALVLPVGGDVWVAYDLDLMRIACVWRAEPDQEPFSHTALAPLSYHVPGQKTKAGQINLPTPKGELLWTNGIYAGLQSSTTPLWKDPRLPGPDPDEVGRGGWSGRQFGFRAVDRDGDGVELLCELDGHTVVTRFTWQTAGEGGRELWVEFESDAEGVAVVGRSTLSEEPRWLRLGQGEIQRERLLHEPNHSALPVLPQRPDWSAPVTTRVEAGEGAPYAMDRIPLPVPNPWQRSLRIADIAFGERGMPAAVVTMDGDVWTLTGLSDPAGEVEWRRFTSGLHEPMSIVARNDEWFVFDRNGVWRLVDRDGDGLADRHEMFCHLFGQTAETREFPNAMKLAPDGSFLLSKGGQEGTRKGTHNGTVLRIAPDGETFEVVATGLRQPFIGVHPETGMITSSDQQGHFVPSTPIHRIDPGRYYGHLPEVMLPAEHPSPIARPMAWIPHPVNSSGATQVWALDERFGPLSGDLIHVGFNRPELFRVLINERFEDPPQAAVVSLSRELPFGALNAKMNPEDGQLYVTGFRIWGTTGPDLSGLVRMRYSGGDQPLLKSVTPVQEGVLLEFSEPMDPESAGDPANYSAERWNYLRSEKYGSPHLRMDGETGQEWMTASSAYLSEDGLRVVIGFPGMRSGVNQMRLGMSLRSRGGLELVQDAYFSPWELAPFDPASEGFGNIEIDLTPRETERVVAGSASAAEGEKLYQMLGCMACHSIDGSIEGKVGPSWLDLYGSERELIAKGGRVRADEAYLRESILDPSAKMVKGYEKLDAGMPIYAGILNEMQIESLILYIKTLTSKEGS